MTRHGMLLMFLFGMTWGMGLGILMGWAGCQ